MATYINPKKYSLLDELPSTQYGTPQKTARLQETSMMQGGGDWLDSFGSMSPGTAQATTQGLQSGGLSGALMSGGMAAGNPYAIAGGLVLSEIEAKQKAKAAKEQEDIANEKQRRSNIMNLLQSNSKTRFGI